MYVCVLNARISMLKCVEWDKDVDNDDDDVGNVCENMCDGETEISL